MNNLVIKEDEEKICFGDYSDITIKKGGKLHYYHIPTNDAEVNIYVEEGGFCESLLLFCPEKDECKRVKITVNLDGTGAETISNAIYLLGKKADYALNMTVNHLAGNTASNQYAKGILTDSAFLDFVGLVNINPNLKDISGNQLNEAMILSEQARIKCIPELSILSEDVKCTHGASLGNLDEQQLFYLQSRGLPYDTARYLILSSFTNALTDKIADSEIKNDFCERISKWLKQNL